MRKLFPIFILFICAVFLSGCVTFGKPKRGMTVEEARKASSESLDSKITALSEDTSPDSADIGYSIDDPSGTPTSKKATWGNIIAKAHSLGNWKLPYTNGSGVLSALSLGADDTFLVSTGASGIPEFRVLALTDFPTTGTWTLGAATIDLSAATVTFGLEAGDIPDISATYVPVSAFTQDGGVLVGTGAGTYDEESGATLRTSIGVGTGDSPQFTGIELSHATENTLTASGGVLSIEGDPMIRGSDVDDTPVNGVTTAPVSSNWAYDHVDAADPHAGYMLESNIGVGSGNYLQLDASPGTCDDTTFLRGDMTCQTVPTQTYPDDGIAVADTGAWGTSLAVVTEVGSPGADTNIPTEQGVREAITAAGGMSDLSDDGSPTLGGNLETGGYYILDSAPSGDQTVGGGSHVRSVTIDSGSSSTFGSCLSLASDGEYEEADASDNTKPCKVLAIEDGTGAKLVLRQGEYRDDDLYNWTPGQTLYLSESTGAITSTAPSTASSIVQIVGYAVSADVIYFNPSPWFNVNQ